MESKKRKNAINDNGTAIRTKMMSKDTPHAVCFLDFPSTSLIHYTCKILEPPYSHPVIVVERKGRGNADWNLIDPTGKETKDYLGVERGSMWGSESESFYREILKKSRTLVMYGSSLQSLEEEYVEEIQQFYNNGGTVLVVGGSCDVLNNTFGCNWEKQWNRRPDEHFVCIPTESAKKMLGTDCDGRLVVPESIYIGRAKLIIAPKDDDNDEVLYLPRPYTSKRDFIRDRHGENIEDYYWDEEKQNVIIEKFLEKYNDPDWYEECYRPAEIDWEEYTPYKGSPIVIHQNENKGSVVYVGDTLNEDTRMRSVLARLMTTDFEEKKQAYKAEPKYRY